LNSQLQNLSGILSTDFEKNVALEKEMGLAA